MPHRAATANKPGHDEACPLGLRLMAFACAQLQQANAELSKEGEQLHTGIHEARKCIRRVRATLALGRRRLGERGARLDDELGRLVRGLSRMRDAQALIEALRRLDSTATGAVAAILPAAETAARTRRDQMLAQLLAKDPGFQSRQRRLHSLHAKLVLLDWQAVAGHDVSKALSRSERRARKASRKAIRHPERNNDWHIYRRRLRRLRQQHSALSELEFDLRPVDKDLFNCAEALGESQDDVLLLSHCGRRSPFPSGSRALLRAVARERLHAIRKH